MAEPSLRVSENVAGPYFVDETCIDCDMCRSSAPQIYRRNQENGRSYVYQQPIAPEEFAAAEEARIGCPTDSIGVEEATRIRRRSALTSD